MGEVRTHQSGFRSKYIDGEMAEAIEEEEEEALMEEIVCARLSLFHAFLSLVVGETSERGSGRFDLGVSVWVHIIVRRIGSCSR